MGRSRAPGRRRRLICLIGGLPVGRSRRARREEGRLLGDGVTAEEGDMSWRVWLLLISSGRVRPFTFLMIDFDSLLRFMSVRIRHFVLAVLNIPVKRRRRVQDENALAFFLAR